MTVCVRDLNPYTDLHAHIYTYVHKCHVSILQLWILANVAIQRQQRYMSLNN